MARLYVDVAFFSFFFSVLFCVACGLVDKFLRFWIFLELLGMSIIPGFFYNRGERVEGFYGSLFTYIVMSGISSFLLISGIILTSFYRLIILGFFIKFGLFPFRLWVYRVLINSKWCFIFLLTVVTKMPILFFCYLLQGDYRLLLIVDCSMTLIGCSILFWWFSTSWENVWCHISLGSVSTLIVACFSRDYLMCCFIYGYYFLWSCFCIYYLSSISSYEGSKGNLWAYRFLLLITPVSLPLFYKISVCVGIFYSSIIILLVWCIYRFSEQYFLYKNCGDVYYSRVYKNWFC